ncbi:ABC transporter permease [Saccharothrix syringae]|uniref:ABC transporter permease n=1 Tax=Saccharothrix syringae TaxID=103733 RepID=A0A5Q0H239_SACSY|nr:ABC transporter permease [Saccharothrix syringae]QFZ19742.1 ABC transporter permease [Saccharothrix syringae]
MRFRDVVLAELDKLRTLPAVVTSAVLTVLVTVGLAGLVAPVESGLRAVEYGQAGVVLLGVLAVGGEYADGQVRTTLLSVPRRGLLLAGKGVAYLVVASLTAVSAVGGVAAVLPGVGVGPAAGAVVYLVLVGFFAHAVATLTRDVVGALVAVLTLVLLVSPLLAAVTRVAEYLPGRVGAQLYRTTAADVPGAAVLCAWVVVAGAVAAAAFVRRDA